MKIQKLILCLGLVALVSAPLAGCSSTWNGVKNDWHDMTGSSDSSSSDNSAAAAPAQPAAQPAAAPAPAAAPTTPVQQDTSTYNR